MTEPDGGSSPAALYLLGMESWVAQRLLEWATNDWQGELTFSFSSGAGVTYVREVRQTMISPMRDGKSALSAESALWGNIRFGAVTLAFREGERYMIEEVRTTRRPADLSQQCQWLDVGTRCCCLGPEPCPNGSR
jgi:hypothetical protein